MPDFDVGHVGLQGLLEWVDQPPPQQARDTHALLFRLRNIPVEELLYMGLMFFRPGNPTSPIFQQQPGLSGVGHILPTVPACQKVLGPTAETLDHDSVRVDLRFRPPRVFAALHFLNHGQVVRSVEATRVEVSHFEQPVHIRIDPPDGWSFELPEKTTVLFDHP